MQSAMNSKSIVNRMMGAARLDVATYEDVEHDTTATTQAVIVVALATVAGAIGGAGNGGRGVVAGVVGSLVGWAVFTACVYFIGTRLLASAATSATFGEVLRTTGFAYTPSILGVVGFIPILGGLVAFAASIWFIVASIVALKSALEVSTGRAIAIGLLSALAAGIVIAIVSAIIGVGVYGT